MEFSFEITQKTRELFKTFLDNYTIEELTKIPQGFSNSIFWNIKHVVVTQQLLVYNLSGISMMLSKNEIESYKKGSSPAGTTVTQEEITLLKEQLFTTLEKTKKDFQNGIFKEFNAYTVSTKTTLNTVKEAIEFNNFHEGIHLGTIFSLRKFL